MYLLIRETITLLLRNSRLLNWFYSKFLHLDKTSLSGHMTNISPTKLFHYRLDLGAKRNSQRRYNKIQAQRTQQR